MGLPTIQNYGQYGSNNYGAHTLMVRVMGVDVYFSYNTVIAFSAPSCGLVVHTNDWGKTTGKHLNWIEHDHGKRVSNEVFQQMWKEHVEEQLTVIQNPNWKQLNPLDQMTAILFSLEGYLSISEINIITPEFALKRDKELYQQLKELMPFLRKGSW